MTNDAAWIAEIARAEAEKLLDERTLFLLSRMYFNSSPEDDKLVTVGHVRRMLMVEGKMTHDIQQRQNEQITALRQRIAELEKPWWRRWFH